MKSESKRRKVRMKLPEQNGLIFGFEKISAKKVNYL